MTHPCKYWGPQHYLVGFQTNLSAFRLIATLNEYSTPLRIRRLLTLPRPNRTVIRIGQTAEHRVRLLREYPKPAFLPLHTQVHLLSRNNGTFQALNVSCWKSDENALLQTIAIPGKFDLLSLSPPRRFVEVIDCWSPAKWKQIWPHKRWRSSFLSSLCGEWECSNRF